MLNETLQLGGDWSTFNFHIQTAVKSMITVWAYLEVCYLIIMVHITKNWSFHYRKKKKRFKPQILWKIN